MRVTVLVLSSAGLVCIYWLNSGVFGMATAGPYDIKIESVGRCPEKYNGKDTLSFTSKLQRVSRNKLIVFIYATFLTSLTDDIKMRMNLAKKTSQGWKDNYFIIELPKACSLMFSLLPQFKGLLAKDYNIHNCPIPPGNYTVPVDLKLDNFNKITPMMEYGKVRARVFYHQGGDTLMCIEAFVEYVPKKKNG